MINNNVQMENVSLLPFRMHTCLESCLLLVHPIHLCVSAKYTLLGILNIYYPRLQREDYLWPCSSTVKGLFCPCITVLILFTFLFVTVWSGRAQDLHAGGHRFESCSNRHGVGRHEEFILAWFLSSNNIKSMNSLLEQKSMELLQVENILIYQNLSVNIQQ